MNQWKKLFEYIASGKVEIIKSIFNTTVQHFKDKMNQSIEEIINMYINI